LKRLNWPALAQHPFVAESDADRETKLNNDRLQAASYGGQGGPRQRLAHIMGSNQNKLLQTTNVRGTAVINSAGHTAELPYAKRKRERSEAKKRETARIQEETVLKERRNREMESKEAKESTPLKAKEEVSEVQPSSMGSGHKVAWDKEQADRDSRVLSAMHTTPIKGPPVDYHQTPDLTLKRHDASALVTPVKTPVKTELNQNDQTGISMIQTPMVHRAPVSRIVATEVAAEEVVEDFSGLKIEQNTVLMSRGSQVIVLSYLHLHMYIDN
jgi:hypothetical protein